MSALLALSEAVENCDPYTRGHSARVARMAYEVGLRLDCDESELALLTLGGALHDVGKLGVRDEVLNKPGPLTADELREVRAHPEIGARMVARILGVVDSYDAMTSDRPYRRARPETRAAEEVERCAGTQFDPEVAEAFLDAWESGAFHAVGRVRATAGDRRT